MVAVDPGLLERSVANLVENAVKYSPAEERFRRGTLTAEDTLGGGLTMVLTLPAAPVAHPSRPGLPATATSWCSGQGVGMSMRWRCPGRDGSLPLLWPEGCEG
ncbi:hypothetical protein QFZ24_008447 [Streptomyces phaeochromogenes]|uniref:hypothetical protein n=1 Tax=Streptomyces phaeochromogenes TaxID=1923 RepID=UPI002794E7DC|nr:hypothetical protein [Streptomyces phaeochromogenes]MDQ0954524.1 hypothetical protein [Streptomyces phaeochromogenes]